MSRYVHDTRPPRPRASSAASAPGCWLLGAILFAIGLVIVLLVDGGTPEGIGVAFMSLAAVPVLAGLALTGSALDLAPLAQGQAVRLSTAARGRSPPPPTS